MFIKFGFFVILLSLFLIQNSSALTCLKCSKGADSCGENVDVADNLVTCEENSKGCTITEFSVQAANIWERVQPARCFPWKMYNWSWSSWWKRKFATVTLLTTATKICAKPEIMSIQHRARELALLSPAVLLFSFQLCFCCCFWISFIHNSMI